MQYRGKKTTLTDKWCPGCKTWKPHAAFGKTTLQSGGLKSQCQKCRHNSRKNFSYRTNQCKQSAKKRGLEWLLSTEQLKYFSEQACIYCGQLNNVKSGVGLDRIDHNKGYIIDNVVPCCARCNITRNTNFSFEEMLLIGATIMLIDKTRDQQEQLSYFTMNS